MKPIKGYGLQTWSVRDHLQKDYIKGLEELKAMGYSGLEFAGYGGLSAEALKAEMERIGLRSIASHTNPDAIKGDGLKRELEYCAKAGIGALILPCVIIKTYDEALATAEMLSRMGEEGKQYGILAGFHNHGFEFVDENGIYSVDYIMENTDPETVFLEQDIFWTEHAGKDHIEYLKRHKERTKLIHLKQRGADGSNPELPDGILDIKKVIEIAQGFGIDEFIVEQEGYPSGDSMKSAKIDIDYLNDLF